MTNQNVYRWAQKGMKAHEEGQKGIEVWRGTQGEQRGCGEATKSSGCSEAWRGAERGIERSHGHVWRGPERHRERYKVMEKCTERCRETQKGARRGCRWT